MSVLCGQQECVDETTYSTGRPGFDRNSLDDDWGCDIYDKEIALYVASLVAAKVDAARLSRSFSYLPCIIYSS